ncbi:hypothetical protein EVAR_23489_1 [Eumeta japonica]|uniref:Uncharacterized protein n=1 Tax=Eumeta variegata TaxID=151549 RepID=A0A4C1UKW0_EUMVA|nr:hypothetical protein EVAR_23489_1 [Eumeta japonica]
MGFPDSRLAVGQYYCNNADERTAYVSLGRVHADMPIESRVELGSGLRLIVRTGTKAKPGPKSRAEAES